MSRLAVAVLAVAARTAAESCAVYGCTRHKTVEHTCQGARPPAGGLAPDDRTAYSVNSRSEENFIRNTSILGPRLEYVFMYSMRIPQYSTYFGQNGNGQARRRAFF